MKTEMSLNQYLSQIDHALEGMREPENLERDEEINAIQKQVRAYISGIERVDTRQMKMAILAGLDELAPRIERLVQTGIQTRPTDPGSAPDEIEVMPKSEKRPIY